MFSTSASPSANSGMGVSISANVPMSMPWSGYAARTTCTLFIVCVLFDPNDTGYTTAVLRPQAAGSCSVAQGHLERDRARRQREAELIGWHARRSARARARAGRILTIGQHVAICQVL